MCITFTTCESYTKLCLYGCLRQGSLLSVYDGLSATLEIVTMENFGHLQAKEEAVNVTHLNSELV